MDKENTLALVSLYHFSSKIDTKINLKKSILVGVNPEVQMFRHPNRPEQAIKNILLMNPKDVYLDGVELEKFCVQQHLRMKPNNT